MTQRTALRPTDEDDPVEAAILHLSSIMDDIRGVVMFWGFWVPLVSLVLGFIVLLVVAIAHA